MAGKSAALTINVVANAAKAKAGFKDAEKGALSLKGQFEGLKTQMMGKAGVAMGFAALGAYALKAVNAFTTLAKSAVDLGKATGLGTEQASRWLAVADDMGVSAEGLATSFKIINKDIDSAKWATYGIATRDAAGEARKANDVFLDTLDTISALKDPTARARAGNELFGKSWAAIAPLVGKTREEYDLMLQSVEAGQVITSQEAAQAEEMRLAQDALADAFNEVTLAVGSFVASMAPAISAFADFVGFAAKGIGVLAGTDATSLTSSLSEVSKSLKIAEGDMYGSVSAFEDLYLAAYNGRSSLDKFSDAVDGTVFNPFADEENQKGEAWLTAFNELMGESPELALQASTALQEWYNQVDDPGMEQVILDQADAWGLDAAAINNMVIEAEAAVQQEEELNRILKIQNDLLDGLTEAWEDYLGLLDSTGAADEAQQALLDLTYAIDDPTTAIDEFAVAQRDAANEVAGFIKTAENLPKDIQLQMLADLQSGDLNAVYASIESWKQQNPVTIPIDVQLEGVAWDRFMRQLSGYEGGFGGRVTGTRATGGPVMGGSTYLVGEQGPELFTTDTSGTIIPNGAFGGGGYGGGDTSIIVNMPAGADGDEVVRALQRWVRANGQLPLPVSSKTVR